MDIRLIFLLQIIYNICFKWWQMVFVILQLRSIFDQIIEQKCFFYSNFFLEIPTDTLAVSICVRNIASSAINPKSSSPCWKLSESKNLTKFIFWIIDYCKFSWFLITKVWKITGAASWKTVTTELFLENFFLEKFDLNWIIFLE